MRERSYTARRAAIRWRLVGLRQPTQSCEMSEATDAQREADADRARWQRLEVVGLRLSRLARLKVEGLSSAIIAQRLGVSRRTLFNLLDAAKTLDARVAKLDVAGETNA